MEQADHPRSARIVNIRLPTIFFLAVALACRTETADAAGGYVTIAEAQHAREASDVARHNASTQAVEPLAHSVVAVQTEILEQSSSSPRAEFFGGTEGERVLPGLGSGF